MSLQFGAYEPWMREQIIDMFCDQYGNERKQFAAYFDSFYGTFQEGNSIRVTVTEGETVAGFVSFSYWPYRCNGKTYKSLQCGNVIINKQFRGKGLYNRMLEYADTIAPGHGIDFIVGFPIKEILHLYLKGGWNNPLNLNWYVKVLNPLGKAFPVSERSLAKHFSETRKFSAAPDVKDQLSLNADAAFYTWNTSYNNLNRQFYFVHSNGKNTVEFALKLNKRKYFNELIVGEVNTDTDSVEFISDAFRQLRKRTRGILGVSILSICVNDSNPKQAVYVAMQQRGFRKIDRDIKFIYRNYTAPEQLLAEPKNWHLFRRDIDTW